MNTLPVELIHDIVSYVTGRDDKLSIVCASRCFQVPVEISTFSCIKLNSFELFDFKHHFRYVHRQNALRHIRYTIRLPPYSVNSARRFESMRTRRINNKAFTIAMVGLLQVLSSWDNHHNATFKDYGAGIYLQLCEIYSDSDPGYQELSFTSELNLERWKDLKQWRYKHSYLRLIPVPLTEISTVVLKPEYMPYTFEEVGDPEGSNGFEKEKESFVMALPKVQRITKFKVGCLLNLERKIETKTAALLAGTMPNLNTFSIKRLRDDETRFPKSRQSMRLEFGLTLFEMCTSNQHFLNLQTLKLRLESPDPCNHNYSVSAIDPTHTTTDYLSVGLHALSRLPNIKTLQLGMYGGWQTSISSSLFWPDPLEGQQSPPSWPSLEVFEIAFSPLTPTGTWYITRDPSTHPTSARPSRSSSPIYSSGSDSDPDTEDDFPDRPVTPPAYPSKTLRAQAYTNPLAGADCIHPHRESRLAGRLPFNPFRTILDPESFTPLLLSVLKMIAVARQQKLATLVFSLDVGACFRKYKRIHHRRLPWMSVGDIIDFKLSFFRGGVSNPGPNSKKVGCLDHDELVILVRERWKWEGIGEREEVMKAMRDAVGEDGVVTVDPEFVHSGPKLWERTDSSDEDFNEESDDSTVYLHDDDADDDDDNDGEEGGSGDDDDYYDDDDYDNDDYYDEDDEDILPTRMKVRMTRRNWPR